MLPAKDIVQVLEVINNFNTLKLKGDKIFNLYMNIATWNSLIPKNKTICIKHLIISIDNQIPEGIIQTSKLCIEKLPSAEYSYLSRVDELVEAVGDHEIAYLDADTYSTLKMGKTMYVATDEAKFCIGASLTSPPQSILVLPSVEQQGRDLTWSYKEYMRRTTLIK